MLTIVHCKNHLKYSSLNFYHATLARQVYVAKQTAVGAIARAMQYGKTITQEPQRENNAADYIILDREIVMNVFISSCTFFCFCTFLTFFEKDLFPLTFLHRRLEQQNMTRHQLMHPESNESLLILLRRLAT